MRAPFIPSSSVATTNSAYPATPAKNSRPLACNFGPICHNTPSGDVTIPPPPNPKSRTRGPLFRKKIARSYSFLSPLSHNANRINSELPPFCTKGCAKQAKTIADIFAFSPRIFTPKCNPAERRSLSDFFVRQVAHSHIPSLLCASKKHQLTPFIPSFRRIRVLGQRFLKGSRGGLRAMAARRSEACGA